jgi:flagellar basal-body rod modification protein FlgD
MIGANGQDPSEQFLKLLVAQITNQDPDHPMDSTDMITQFAQIQSALGLNSLIQSSQNYQRVATAGTLLNQPVTVYDADRKLKFEGTVKGLDFSGTMPLVNVDGRMFPLEAVKTLGDI